MCSCGRWPNSLGVHVWTRNDHGTVDQRHTVCALIQEKLSKEEGGGWRGCGDLYRHTKMALVEDFESKSLLARGGLRLHVRASAFRVGTELLVLQIARAEWERGALPHKSTMLCTLWPARPATAGVRPASGTPLVPMQRSLCASHLQGIWFVVTP